jgi:hypothetical protein
MFIFNILNAFFYFRESPCVCTVEPFTLPPIRNLSVCCPVAPYPLPARYSRVVCLPPPPALYAALCNL